MNDSNESLGLKRDGFVGICDSSSKKKEEYKIFLKKNILRPYDFYELQINILQTIFLLFFAILLKSTASHIFPSFRLNKRSFKITSKISQRNV